ncbi:hypothetical protein [Nocardia sp. NPDC004604]|uniref:hypothetical protein n=1 Tax=Nocardia sp. NPDC004604 TaxID=3157013 RepID=UPI0033BA5C94
MKIRASAMPSAASYQPGRYDAGIRRYFGLGQFALLSGVPYRQLCYWRHSTHVWIPGPDIQVGDHPGWSLACIHAWEPEGQPFLRPPTTAFADMAAVRARYHGMPTNTLWACVGDGTIPRPVVWVDDWPGWLA